jgi:hypothetical protein
VFTAALPNPAPGGNLTEVGSPNSTIQPFSQPNLAAAEGRAGLEAVKWFEDRMKRGVRVQDAVADEQSKNPKSLAMVNIDTVHTRYVKDVNAFLQAADTQVQEKFGEAIADWMKDEEREKDASKNDRWKPKATAEPGWVIEIRGWTDYETTTVTGPTFVRQSLLRNLQRMDTFAEQTDPGGKDGKGKVSQYIVGVTDPVKGRVSHAFVYKVFAPNPDPGPHDFPNIRRGSFLDAIVGGGAAQGGTTTGGFPGGPVGPGGPGGPGPLGTDTSTTPSGPAGTPPASGTGTAAAPAADLAPPWVGLGATVGTAVVGEQRPPKKDDYVRRRHEFVVMLIWREPVNPAGAAPAAPTP